MTVSLIFQIAEVDVEKSGIRPSTPSKSLQNLASWFQRGKPGYPNCGKQNLNENEAAPVLLFLLGEMELTERCCNCSALQ